LVSMAGYVALCEGYLRILPKVDLFQLFFSVWCNYENEGFPWTCGTICFLPRRLIRLKHIYNIRCSMLVLHHLLHVLFTLRGIFMQFLELTH
jgi:hypothetical protein